MTAQNESASKRPSFIERRPVKSLVAAACAYFVMTAVLIGFTVYSNHRADVLKASKITMQAKAEKARSRMLIESDIEKLRHFAVAAHDGSERDFSTIVEMTSDFNIALRYLCMALIAMGVALGVPIHCLLRGNKDKSL